jgi:hypothetical protein
MFSRYLTLVVGALVGHFKEAVGDEVYRASFKLLTGGILSSVIVFSLVQMGQVYKAWLVQFENGVSLELLSFGFVAAACLGALYFLLGRRIHSQKRRQQNAQGLLEEQHRRNHRPSDSA